MKKILLSIFCLVVANVFAQSRQTRTLNDGTVEKGFFHNNCGNWKGYCGAVMHGFGITLEGDGKGRRRADTHTIFIAAHLCYIGAYRK